MKFMNNKYKLLVSVFLLMASSSLVGMMNGDNEPGSTSTTPPVKSSTPSATDAVPVTALKASPSESVLYPGGIHPTSPALGAGLEEPGSTNGAGAVATEPMQYYTVVGIGLFSGALIDPVSCLIKTCTNSRYSHTGIVLAEEGHAEDSESWYCFEATGTAEEVLHGIMPHVRLTKWADVLRYSGSVAVRKFRFTEEMLRPSSTDVTTFVLQNNGKLYERDINELLNSVKKRNTEEDTNTVFCSELAAEMCKKLGLWSTTEISSNFTPADFSGEEGRTPLPWKAGVALGPTSFYKESPPLPTCFTRICTIQ